MIFNLSHGGLANISVTAPTGAVITASCEGMTVTGTGTCMLDAPIIGTWHVVCVFDNTEKSSDVVVDSYGQTYSAVFDYAAKIVVTTFPLASVTATKTGQTTLTGTADSSGVCELSVPEGGLGEWSVTSNNGSVSETGTVDVTAYDADYPITQLALVPDITVVIGDDTYRYTGVEITNTNLTITPVDITGWKIWMKTSGTITFNRLAVPVDICAVGKGGNGGSGFSQQGGAYGGGGGGGGGQVVRSYATSLTAGTTYTVTVNSTGSYLGDVISAGNGGNGGSPSGGNSGGNSGDGSTGQWVNDHTWPSPTSGGGGDGGTGVYAFGSADFDNVRYAYGGGGGPHSSSYGGVRHNTPGSGGGGGGGTSSIGRTNGLVGILIMRNAA